MKKFLCFIFLIATVPAFQSCLDKDKDKDKEVEFVFYHQAYIVQTGEGQFRPVAGAFGRNGTIDPSNSTISVGNKILKTESFHTNYIETSDTYRTLSELTGTYTFSIADTEGRKEVVYARIDNAREPGDFEYVQFTYSDGNVRMIITGTSANATHYGIYQRPYMADGQIDPSWFNNEFTAVEAGSAGQQIAVKPQATSSDSMIYPAAFVINNGVVQVVRIDQEGGKRLRGGASSFD